MTQDTVRPVRPTTATLTFANRWDHFLARWAVNRSGHRVEPGLYALGSPTPDSPVFVTANYSLSFDALREALPGIDGYILVLDTHGINVWCAAGKGTFGTEELVRRIQATGLANVVRHRVVILPQLGAPGIAAHEIRKQSGFKVEYGPVRAADLPAYLRTHTATEEMRRVEFTLLDRLVLIPVELILAVPLMLIAAIIAYFFGGFLAAAGIVAAVLAGTVLFPILLPWLPSHAFSGKGLVLGAVVALPFALVVFLGSPDQAIWLRGILGAAYLLALPPITAYLALNFTGTSTFTSRTGVRREIFTYIPVMAFLLGGGILFALAHAFIRTFGGS